MAHVLLVQSDARQIPLKDQSVHCCVTSPPFWGLRDYGTATWEGGDSLCRHIRKLARQDGGRANVNGFSGSTKENSHKGARHDADVCHTCGALRIDAQLGLEQWHDCLAWARGEPPCLEGCYVCHLRQVFAEVHRVLRDDGVMFLNLGDSFNANGRHGHGTRIGSKQGTNRASAHGQDTNRATAPGLKPKDLCGIPWAVAKALQAPTYLGTIPRERDRVWLSAMIDAEGTICGFTHNRKDGDGIRTGILISITNSNLDILDEAHRIWAAALSDHGRPGPGHLGQLETKRWVVNGSENKANLLQELYPYFIAKKKQAIIGWNFLQISIKAKRGARIQETSEVKEKRNWAVRALSQLNHSQNIDIPDWCIEPPPVQILPGWYLRSDLIWSKPNPMPESVTDRPTRAHEYVFLFSKKERYFYDAEAIADHCLIGANGSSFTSAYDHATKPNLGTGPRMDTSTRNARTVWTIASQPFAGAHFACFPPELARRAILAGTSAHGVCRACGAPWIRRVERQRTLDGHIPVSGTFAKPDEPFRIPPNGKGHARYSTQVTEHGWHPTCRCHAFVGPAIVFDPFCGSGTAGLVARALGRHAVLCDLSATYLRAIARERLGLTALAHWQGTGTAVLPETYTDLPLFTGT